MKYAYMVTRNTSGAAKGIIHNANLGLHTSKRDADRHFDCVLKSRKDIGCSIAWDICPDTYEQPMGRREVRTAYIKHTDGLVEYLIIERWNVYK